MIAFEIESALPFESEETPQKNTLLHEAADHDIDLVARLGLLVDQEEIRNQLILIPRMQ